MISFTDRAREMLLSFVADGEEETQALRITVGGSPMAPTFDLILVNVNERTDDEEEMETDGLAVFVKTADVATLEGAAVDYIERVNESGFEVRPVASTTAPGTRRVANTTGPIADRVREVLDSQVNPAIAAHGGQITLIDVEDNEIYVEMGGGCQGCALSRMTLRQGVERMLREAIPELTAVHDVTDHSSGENPYL